MGMLDQLTPMQRNAVMVGVPLVGGVVLLQTMRGGSAPVEEETDPTAADPSGFVSGYMPDAAAVGTGELMDIVSGITNGLLGLTQSVQDLENKGASTPPPKTGTTSSAQPNGWNVVGGSPPVDGNGKVKASYGKGTWTVPAGGRRLDVIARNVYTSSKYVGYVVLANADRLPGGQSAGSLTYVPAGTRLRV